MACFDFAACAPYVEIDMNPEPEFEGEDPSIDAIFISPHKFLGGPGSSGVLVFNERIYDRELPPSMSAGGTVDYVGMTDQDFIVAIEEREKAGTPGVLQTLKAGLVFQVKDAVGVDVIYEREHEFTKRAMRSWGDNEQHRSAGQSGCRAAASASSRSIFRDVERQVPAPQVPDRACSMTCSVSSRAPVVPAPVPTVIACWISTTTRPRNTAQPCSMGIAG